MKKDPEPSPVGQTRLSEINPIELVMRGYREREPMTYCVEIKRNSVHHPVIVISRSVYPDTDRELVTRIPFNSVLKYFAVHRGRQQSFTCFDDENPPQQIPLVITQLRERPPEVCITTTDGWGIRPCQHCR